MTNAAKNEPILLDQEGYDKFLAEIEDLKEQLTKIDIERGTACSDAVGDSWHDNFAHDEAVRKERFVTNQLKEKYEQLKRIKIVSKSEAAISEGLIEIGDIVTLDMIAQTGKVKEHIIKIVATFGVSTDGNIREVSIDSPLGNAIYHKKAGDKAGYSVNGKSFTINIKSVSRDNENDKGPVHTK